MIRELFSKLSRTISERKASVRRRHSVPVKVCFTPEKKSLVKSQGRCDDLFLSGETSDVSETGIGFVVASIRIKEKYLVGQDRLLNLELDLSGEKIRMQVKGVRYERVGIHLSTERYLVGAEIVSVNEEDAAAYEDFLKHGHSSGGPLSSIVEVGAK